MATSWPPSSGVTTPRIPREQAVLTVSASIRINAPASLVFDTVLNVADYPKWNTFIPEVEISSQPEGSSDSSRLHKGTAMNFKAVMDSNKPDKKADTSLIVTDLSTPEQQSEYIDQKTRKDDSCYTADLNKLYRVSWGSKSGAMMNALKVERFHEVIILSENECEVRTWEVMGGVLAYAVRWMYQQTLSDKFAAYVQELKKFCEDKTSK